MRMSAFLTAAALVGSLAASTVAMAADFSGVPQVPEQQAMTPEDQPAQQQLQPRQTGPYDSPDFVVPPFEVNS